MMLKSYQRFMESRHHGSDYKYGCLLIYLDIPNWDEIISFIQPDDIYHPEDPSKGVETEPHVTVLYGLHDSVTNSDVEEIVNQIDSSELNLKINGIGCFENKDFDVVKFNVECEYLHQINSMFRTLPHTSDYPNYRPHVTIAYVKAGTGKKYDQQYYMKIGSLNRIVYSKCNNQKEFFDIN